LKVNEKNCVSIFEDALKILGIQATDGNQKLRNYFYAILVFIGVLVDDLE